MTDEIVREKGVEQMIPVQLLVTDEIGIGFGGITAPELTQAQAEHEAQRITEFRVSVSREDVPIRDALATCFDGRFGQFLGAKLAGAFKTLEVGARAVGYDVSGKELLERAKSRGFKLGAHVDDTNAAADFTEGTGCGANDKEEVIADHFNENKDVLKPTVLTLVNVNSSFDDASFTDMSLAPTTNDIHKLRKTVGENNVETLVDDGEGVHGHTEWIAYFNYQKDTTIDKDAYFKATGKKLFVVDMWYIKELADAMAEGIDAEQQAADMYQAMVAFQLGTYITLCDGKHRAVIAQDEQPLAA